MKLFYSRNTVGCKIGNKIYIHPELYLFPNLYKAIIEHEKNHSVSYKLQDVKMDLVNEELKGHKKEFYKFIITHPRTMLGFLPIAKIGGKWVFDFTMLLLFLFGLAVFGGLLFSML